MKTVYYKKKNKTNFVDNPIYGPRKTNPLFLMRSKKRHSGNPALRGHPESDSGQARMTESTKLV